MSRETVALALIGFFPVIIMIVLLFVLDHKLIMDLKDWWRRAGELPGDYELYSEFDGMWRLALRKKEGGEDFSKPIK